MPRKEYIRFDWAMKKLLRQKANFGILEGFLTTLLNEKIIIKNLLESESNQYFFDDKQNRIDLLAENSKGELVIIEVQGNTAYDYFQGILYSISKPFSEYINKDNNYANIKKIYCINIVYFSLGKGKDVVYHGKKEFRGIHYNDVLELSEYQQKRFSIKEISPLYPEYYILKVNEFNSEATSHLDEWINYLKSGNLNNNDSAPGLEEVREKLNLDTLTREEYNRYEKQLLDAASDSNNLFGQIEEAEFNGHLRGKAEGKTAGKTEATIEIAKNLLSSGVDIEVVAKSTGLSQEQIKALM